MTVSILALLVALESFVILLAVLFFVARKHSKLKKAFDKLLASMSENIFAKLVEEEIDNTNERIQEIEPTDGDELDLAATTDEITDNESKLSEEEEDFKRALTFRSAYLHAEINAYHASDGDPGLFWLYLAENIAEFIPKAPAKTDDSETEPVSNEFIDEVMQELQSKLDKSTESNLSLQALLDSLLANNQLDPEQISIIKNSQADYYDLSQHVSDLEQKIQNSLNLEITAGSNNPANTVEKTLIIEKATNKVNTETNKLKDIIFDQGNKINNLIKQLKTGVVSSGDTSELEHHLEELERSQKETAMCMEVLEMENHRLIEELDNLQSNAGSENQQQKINELEQIIELKDQELEQLNKEFDSIQSEYMAVYNKGDKSH